VVLWHEGSCFLLVGDFLPKAPAPLSRVP
jgi:hypothetical protein